MLLLIRGAGDGQHWAAAQGARNAADLHLVDVMIGARCIVILPDREVEVGDLAPDEMIHLACRSTPSGAVIDATEIKRVDAAA